MKKRIEVFKLENIDGGNSYSMFQSNEQKLNKAFSALKNPNLYYYLSRADNDGWRIHSLDINTDDNVDHVQFYNLNKNFLYGEDLSSGKCIYGILGSTMHRNFASTDLMLIENDFEFDSIGLSSDYPSLSHDKKEWDMAFIKKEKFLARQKEAANKINALTRFQIHEE